MGRNAERKLSGDQFSFRYLDHELGHMREVVRRLGVRSHELRVKTLDDAIFVPDAVAAANGRAGDRGGLLHGDGSVVTEAAGRRWPKPMPVTPTTVVDQDVIYGGRVFGHYGVFLLESLCRLWAAAQFDPSLPIVFNVQAFTSTQHQLLSVFGIDPERLIVLTEPTRLRRVHIPEPIAELTHWAHDRTGGFYRDAARRVLGECAVDHISDQPLYISRNKLSSSHRQTIGESELESILTENGFAIAHPETMSVADQIKLFNSHKHIFGTCGTALHNALFSLHRPHLHIFVDGLPPREFFLTSAIAEAPTTFIQCLSSGKHKDSRTAAHRLLPQLIEFWPLLQYLTEHRFITEISRNDTAYVSDHATALHSEAWVFSRIILAKRSKEPLTSTEEDEAVQYAEGSWPVAAALMWYSLDRDQQRVEALAGKLLTLVEAEQSPERIERYGADTILAMRRSLTSLPADLAHDLQAAAFDKLGAAQNGNTRRRNASELAIKRGEKNLSGDAFSFRFLDQDVNHIRDMVNRLGIRSHELRVSTLEDLIFVPDSVAVTNGGPGDRGGLLHEDGSVIAEASGRRWPKPMQVKPAQVLAQDVIYGGWIFGQYGHFILETPCRLWAIAQFDPSLPIVFNGRGTTAVQRKVLSAFGIDPERLLFPTEATLLRRVHVPEAISELAHWAHDRTGELYRDAARRVLGEHGPDQVSDQPLYISRNKLSSSYRQTIGEAALEKILSDNGFAIAHPETMSFEEQIKVFNSHRHIFGCSGTAMHNILFSLHRPHLHMFVDGLPMREYFLSAVVAGAPTTFIQCLSSGGREVPLTSMWRVLPQVVEFEPLLQYLAENGFVTQRAEGDATGVAQRTIELHSEAWIYTHVNLAQRARKDLTPAEEDEATHHAEASWPIAAMLMWYWSGRDPQRAAAMASRLQSLVQTEGSPERIERYGADAIFVTHRCLALLPPDLADDLLIVISDRLGLPPRGSHERPSANVGTTTADAAFVEVTKPVADDPIDAPIVEPRGPMSSGSVFGRRLWARLAGALFGMRQAFRGRPTGDSGGIAKD
ncbi:glycosyltransferase family 61 protein [Enterovirga rhinocerotis]|uniref:Uncharacterized protein DUF563 n=1 Tax=Enterovirga rhinocerotis TaxID=1339210 RepID=A0A4R7C7T2_9HYPH|nr:glycosyltransferase 61 family protein [Enterovirga rhinocerotis]TDR93295.1 uncharacterized protein DUF563 [Enterovirga rhinocerotis]